MTKHSVINLAADAYILAEPTYSGVEKASPERLESVGPYDAIERNNNAYATGRAYILPAAYDRVTVGIVFQATKFAAQGVARAGYDVYMLLESGKYVAHRPRRLA